MKEKILKGIAKFGRLLLKAFVYVAFRPKIRYTEEGRKNCKYNEPVIFIGNHTSHMDGVMSAMIFDRCRAYIIVAKDWYEKKKVNWFLRNNLCIPMDRFNVDTAWLRLAKDAIKGGNSMIIYPEGKTRKEAEPDEFKSGFIMLSMLTGAKIIPFATGEDYHIIFGRRQRVLVGEPMTLTEKNKGMNPKYLEEESERFRQSVINLQKQLEQERK